MFYIVLLVFFGLLFLVAELVLLPGVSIGALLSLVCYGSSIYLAFRDYGPLTGQSVVIAILVLSCIAIVISLRAKTWQRFSLKQEIHSRRCPNRTRSCKSELAEQVFRVFRRWGKFRLTAGSTKPNRRISISIRGAMWKWSVSRISA